MARDKQPRQIMQMTVSQFEALFPNEDACDAFLVRKYLPLYVAEFQFRYNNRHNPDIFQTAIAAC